MVTPLYSIAHSGTGTNVGTNTDLTEATTIRTSHGIEQRVGTFTIKLPNPQQSDGVYKYADRFQAGDDMWIFFGTSEGGSQINLRGEIKEWSYDLEERGRVLSIKGTDLTSKLMDSQYYGPFQANTYTASDIVKEVINTMNDHLDSSQQITTNNVVSTGSIISNYSRYNGKKVYEIIKEMSTAENTGSGNFLFWVDSSKDLHFAPKPASFDTQIDEGKDVITMQPTKNIYDVKNFLIIDCGIDNNEEKISIYAANDESIGEAGWREDYWVYHEAARQAKELYGTSSGSNALVRAMAKELGKKAGDRRLHFLTQPRWQASITLQGTNDYNVGNQVYLYSEGLGWTATSTDSDSSGVAYKGKKLRIRDIIQEFSEKGWRTKLTLKEDSDIGK